MGQGAAACGSQTSRRGAEPRPFFLTHRLALIGVGKIARDAHLPAIAANPAFELVAVSNLLGPAPARVAIFADHRELLAAPLAVDVVAVCTPPSVRHGIAAAALGAGMDVLLEKPPAATSDELSDLERLASRHGRVLFTAWHSRYNAAVEQARAWLTGRRIAGLDIAWKEDVRRWHPDQEWIWRQDGFGVFDPGINALSVLTHILPEPVAVDSAELWFAAPAQTPIAASISFRTGTRAAGMHAAFDWRPTPVDMRDIAVTTDDGHRLELADGGARLVLDGEAVTGVERAEYTGVYAHFEVLLRTRACCVDGRPLQLTADAFRLGRRLIA